MNSRFGPRHFYAALALGALLVLAGLGSAHYMEEHGHIVTGMTNQVVWGLPHVFAIFMIVAASGGEVTSQDGSPIEVRKGNVLASNGRIHKAMVKELARAKKVP